VLAGRHKAISQPLQAVISNRRKREKTSGFLDFHLLQFCKVVQFTSETIPQVSAQNLLQNNYSQRFATLRPTSHIFKKRLGQKSNKASTSSRSMFL
jgi:hypothetical protein